MLLAIKVLLLIAALTAFWVIYRGFMPEYVLSDFESYCAHFNYPVQNFDVVTDDGYILKVFRIQKKGSQIRDGLPVVFFQHGVLDCSDTFIINEEEKAPAFMLANQGYDVWFGNNRGNFHSRRHIKYDPDKDKAFWDFTFQDMGEKDIPAMFQKVLQQTNGQKINYVAHSEGTMQMFIALSERLPIVVNNIRKFVAFGPVAYCYNSYRGKYQNLYKWGWLLDPMASLLHPKEEVMPPTWFVREIGSRMCHYVQWICSLVIAEITNYKPKYDNAQIYDAVAGRDPAGTSKKNIDHFLQLIHYQKFQKFDYGAQGNMEHYGQKTPPLWDLGQIQERIALVSGKDDKMADPKDVARLESELVHAKQLKKIIIDGGHLTYMWGKNMSFMKEVAEFLAEE